MNGLKDWDIAIRYHEFKFDPEFESQAKKLRQISARAVLERAKTILGSVVRPYFEESRPFLEVPAQAARVELDLEETLENSICEWTLGEMSYPNLWMSFARHREQPLIITVDTSLSMTGEKLALTAVALAVVLLEFSEDPLGIIAFENSAKVVKTPEEKISVFELIERFLDVPAQGYTHLEEGLQKALEIENRLKRKGIAKAISTILLTDGKYTAGKDPAYLAHRFSHLIVLKMGKERASLGLCEELAWKGHGALREIGNLADLPLTLYGAVKDILRGRAVSLSS